jgi:hypothetical protein
MHLTTNALALIAGVFSAVTNALSIETDGRIEFANAFFDQTGIQRPAVGKTLKEMQWWSDASICYSWCDPNSVAV